MWETADANIIWTVSSSNPSVATVSIDLNGDALITAIQSGVADVTLTATDEGGLSDSVDVKVTVEADTPSGPLCKGSPATIYVENGHIVGGPKDGKPYNGALFGTSGNDVIVGTHYRDYIYGYSGHDKICSLGGRDRIWGGNGK